MRTAHSSSLVGVYLSAWWDPPWVWVWRPPWVWAWRPSKCWPGDPQARPLIFALGCAPGDPPGAGLETPRCGPGDISKCQTPQLPPLGVGLETPPGQTPQLCPPLWCGPADLQGMLGYQPPPPWRPARQAGIPPAMHAGIPPRLWTEWQGCAKILTCPKLCLRAVKTDQKGCMVASLHSVL